MAKTVHTSLLIIGGAKDKVGRATVLRGFVRLAGARSARIVVIPSASSLPAEAAQTYNTVFGRLGAPEVVIVSPPSRRSAATERVSGHGQCHRRLHDGGQPAQDQAALGRHAPDRGHLPSARARLRRGWCVGRSLDHEPVHDLPGCEQGDPRSAPASSRPDWACCPASSSTSILMSARPQAVPERQRGPASATETTQPLRHANHPYQHERPDWSCPTQRRSGAPHVPPAAMTAR